MNGTTAAKTIAALENVFSEQTYPETIRSDNGPPFSSEEFSNYCLSKNIRLVRTIPYWPQMNGLVERHNQGVLRALKIAKATKCDWRKAVRDYEYMYNTTPHTVTGKAPLELLTGRPVKDLLPSMRTEPYWHRDEETRDRDAIRKMEGKIYADNRRHAKESDIGVGDAVMLKNYESGKLEPSFKLEKYVVVKKTGSDVIVENEEGLSYRRPVAHLRKWPSSRSVHDLPVPMDSSSGSSSSAGPSGVGEDKLLPKRKAERRTSDLEGGHIQQRPKRMKKLPARYNE